MALGRKTGGRRKGTPNRKTALLQAAAVSSENETPLEFLLKLMRNSHVSIETRMLAARLALPFVHTKPVDAEPKLIEVRNVVEPAVDGRDRALALTMEKYRVGLSDKEAEELAALTRHLIS